MIAVVEKKSGKMIGSIYLGNRDCENKEIGYVFHRRFWGKGYATEACRAIIAGAFSSGTHRIFAECVLLEG